MIDPLPKERPTHETKPNTTKKGAVETPVDQDVVDQTRPDQDTIADLFQDRDQLSVPESYSPRALQAEKRSFPQDDKDPQNVDASKTQDDNKNDNKDNTKREVSSSEIQTLKEELEKTQKRLTENQQYGRQNAQRLKTALKVTKEFVEEGSLSEEEAAKLLGSLESDTTDILEEDVYAHHTHPFSKVLATANKELENIRKYTDDDRLDDKVGAFDYFLLVASKEEQEQALEDLTDLMDNPLALAKKMLSIGQRHETSYRDMKDAGGIQGMITKKDQTIDNLRKSLDKLTKKLAQYEDYDKPRYRIDDHVGETSESEEDASLNDSITSLFSHRDAPRGVVGQR